MLETFLDSSIFIVLNLTITFFLFHNNGCKKFKIDMSIIFRILIFRWFHGHIRRGEAESLLHNQPDCSYLIRNSESSKIDFSLSLRQVVASCRQIFKVNIFLLLIKIDNKRSKNVIFCGKKFCKKVPHTISSAHNFFPIIFFR